MWGGPTQPLEGPILPPRTGNVLSPLLPFKLQIYKAFLELNNPGTYTVRVRARDATFSHYKPWGPWSVPQHFGEWEGPSYLFQLLGAPDVPGLVAASLPSLMDSVCPSCSMELRWARGDGYRQHAELKDEPFNAVFKKKKKSKLRRKIHDI